MKVHLLLGTAIVSFLPLLASAEPAELTRLKEQFVKARSQSIDEPILQKVEALKQNYFAALDRAMAAAQGEGSIEEVVEFTGEKERVTENKPAPDHYQSDKLTSLSSAFEEHLQSIHEEETALRKEIAAKLKDALGALEADLTKQKRIEDALDVRRLQEDEKLVELVLGTTTTISDPAVAEALVAILQNIEMEPEDPPAMEAKPAPAPGETRIVIVADDEDNEERPPLDVFKLIESTDRRDILAVGKTTPPVFGMINKDGSLIHYQAGMAEPIEIIASATSCLQFQGLPLIGLNADGTLVLSGETHPDLLSRLKAETNVASVAATSRGVALIKVDGSVKTHSVPGTEGNLPVLETLSDVKEISFAGRDFVFVVRRDGTAARVNRGEIGEIGAINDAVRAHSKTIVELGDGRLASTGVLPGAVAREGGEYPQQVYQEGSRYAAIRKDGSFVVMMSDSGTPRGRWTEKEEIGEALSGVSQFAWVFDEENGWIIAVLPATSVPRSGFWKVNELIEAREAIQSL
ncbi:MAG: hypothetical protein AAF733_01920 [Verrucomicrobiota bacterium]